MPGADDPRQQDLGQLAGPDAALPDQQSVEGIVGDIIYRNDNNGYTVVSLAGPGERIAVGIMPYITEGETVRFRGNWIKHPDYGRQFQVVHYELQIPGSQESILQYLSSGIIKGIGEKTARKLVREFGAETLDILRENPERVAKIKGFSISKARQVAEQLREKRDYQDLVLFLTPLGISQGKILRIYRQFGSDAMQLVSENPFRLADEVYGIGFATADNLARSMGLDPDSPQRVASAIKYLLYQAASRGHTYLPLDNLIYEVRQLIDMEISSDHAALSYLLSDRQIVMSGRRFGDEHDHRVALPGLFRTEKASADRLSILLQSEPVRFAELIDREQANALVSTFTDGQQMFLADEQQEALIKALQSQVLVLTGGPGTGKTTIIKLLCDCLISKGGRVMLAAPTGRAAKRMTEITGIEAKTLHRLLEIQYVPEDSRQEFIPGRNSDVSLSCDLLIVDEMSMVDAFLFKNLLDAIIPGTRLLLVGDADQLPSVGAGYVLKDLIASGAVPVVRLTRIFRQSQESLIIRNAHLIHDGKPPELDQTMNSQFLWISKDSPDEIAQAVIKLCADILPNQYKLDPFRDVQVLTPSRKGPAGTLMMNQQLQKALLKSGTHSHQKVALEAHGSRFSTGDKVMQIRNNYDMTWHLQSDFRSTGCGVFNGELGTVYTVDPEEGSLEVLFDDERLIEYDRMTLEDLELAYAITIHKSQGSEYPVVVLAIPPGAPQLLTRNLLYTAVTRARNKLLLVSSKRVISGMLANNQAFRRYTLLREFLAPIPPNHEGF